jgi:hypothetical protein
MEEEPRFSLLVCPFYTPEAGTSVSGTHMAAHSEARRCRGPKCALWIGTEEEGNCAFAVIAHALREPALRT